MKDLILQNPRKGIDSARIYPVRMATGLVVMLSVNVVTPRMKIETERYKTISAAKSQYSKEYQSPKWFDRAKWVEVDE